MTTRKIRTSDVLRGVPDATYDFSDLVGAWRDARRWADAHQDLRRHFDQRHRAFAAAFGADLDSAPASPGPMPSWMAAHPAIARHSEPGHSADWQATLHRFVLDTEERYRLLAAPFAGYLEAPPELAAVFERYGDEIEVALEDFHRQLRAMTDDLLRALYPEAASRTVTRRALRAHGHDPAATGPDPDDYF